MIGRSLRRYGLRSVVKDGLEKRFSQVWGHKRVSGPDAAFLSTLGEANYQFSQGNFLESMDLIKAAGQIQVDVRNSRGLDRLNLRLCGSEIMNSFGHMGIAMGLRSKLLGYFPEGTRHVLIRTEATANKALADYWGGSYDTIHLNQVEGKQLEASLWPVVESVQWVDDGVTVKHLYEAVADSEEAWEISGKPPPIHLPEPHLERGESLLEKHGIGPQDWFVALHVRRDGNGDSYGRNSNLESFRTAVQRVRQFGGRVILVGGDSPKELSDIGLVDLNIDRTSNAWLDMFLLGACRFMIGTQSGPAVVATMLGTPVLLTNVVGWGFLPYQQAVLAIPKLVRVSSRMQRTMSFSEMMDRGLVMTDSYLPESSDGLLEWHDNAPEQIAHGVDEMLAARYKESPEASDHRLDELHRRLVGYRGLRLLDSSTLA